MIGYKIDGSYDQYSKANRFQLNNGETCKLIDFSETETKWQKIFALSKNDIFKFKFYFQRCGDNHQVIFWGQKFNFLIFRFDLRRIDRDGKIKIFSCKSLADFDFTHFERKYINIEYPILSPLHKNV